ncbi:MAG: multicopper oxidase domain-containing protein [bacterium]
MKKILGILLVLLLFNTVFAHNELTPTVNGDSIIYELTIHYKTVNFTGKETQAIAVNNSIPAPVLRFQEGKIAVIQVTNEMSEEASIHWHGLILPNFQDGVPYLTTPPIRAGKTFTYSFPLKQSGTYWYHSHTGLQEQKGLYGGIIIEPRESTIQYDRDLVLVLSDWTDQDPRKVLKNLKRHNEWYGVKIGNAPSLWDAVKNNTLIPQFKLWADQMPGMHISDIYYDAFLINGKKEQVYEDFLPGEEVRLQVINAAASSYFWLTWAGGDLEIISADGLNVQPVKAEKVLIGIAETYDFIITIAEGKSLEFRATAQDVTGSSSVFMGRGKRTEAPGIPFPNYQKLGRKMAELHGGGDSMELKGDEKGDLKKHDNVMKMSSDHSTDKMQKNTDSAMQHTMQEEHGMKVTDPMIMWNAGYSNTILKSVEPTKFSQDSPVRHLVLNLTGDMWRYNWNINGKPLSKADKIRINKGEVVQITLNNTTMMHHPMHLHGHFFRVLNGNGDHSPLKHTVDIPPMSRTTIEFAASEDKDWFFHCHILYHMSAGMARIFSYNHSIRDKRLDKYPLKNFLKHDSEWFFWGDISGLSHKGVLELVLSNTYNQINLKAEYGWQQQIYEAKLDYERFIQNYFRIYTGLKAETEEADNWDDPHTSGRVGIRYLLLYILDTDISIDHQLRPEIALEAHLPLTKRLISAGHLEWKNDFGWINELPEGVNQEGELVWNVNLEYILGKNFLLSAGYDNRFEWGGGLKILF